MRSFGSLEESLRCLAVFAIIAVVVFFIDVASSYRDIKKGRDNKGNHIRLAYWLAQRIYKK